MAIIISYDEAKKWKRKEEHYLEVFAMNTALLQVKQITQEQFDENTAYWRSGKFPPFRIKNQDAFRDRVREWRGEYWKEYIAKNYKRKQRQDSNL